MPHADVASIAEGVTTKAGMWNLICRRLESLLDGERNWVTNCANAASLIYNVMLSCPDLFGTEGKAVNWVGFYIDGSLFPTSRIHAQHGLGETAPYDSDETDKQRLLLGPFCGKPACQFINVTPGKARGVCADAFVKQRSILVEDVNMYPGHIACDAETSSELVCPLVLYLQGNRIPIGVLDMDSVGLGGFDEDDRIGAERVARLVVNSCDW